MSERQFNDRKSELSRRYYGHEIRFKDRDSGSRGVFTGLNVSLKIKNVDRA